MEKPQTDPMATVEGLSGKASAALGRRVFMRYIGATAAAGVALSACHSELVDPGTTGSGRAGDAIDFGDISEKDVNILNFAYALEQLEAAFYMQAVMTPYSGIREEERRILTEIRDHEIIHRDLFKTALGSAAIPGLTPNFSSINFSSRASVLGTARVFENIGVSAYNGAGQYIRSADYLLLAGKIVSVEARHASIIATLLEPMTTLFAPDTVVYANSGLEEIRNPEEVLSLVRPYVAEFLNGRNGSGRR